MGIGDRIRRRPKFSLAVLGSVALAALAATWSIEKVSLAPPGLSPRSLQMATAATHVVIDTPDSIMIDLRQDAYSVASLTNRALVLGNVIASPSVEAKIAQEAGVPPALLRIQAPLTPQQTLPPETSQTARHISDITKSTNQYRIEINADPTVPMLDIYAQTPSAASAAALANAAVDQLKTYMTALATAQGTPPKDQVRLDQLGRATGLVINDGVQYQMALLVFVLTLAASLATVKFVARRRARTAAAMQRERSSAAGRSTKWSSFPSFD